MRARIARDLVRDQRGSVMILAALSVLVLAGLAGLAIDSSSLYLLQARLQTTADVAALAAVTQLPNETDARAAATTYSGKNMVTAEHGQVLTNSDVAVGNWDDGTETFTAGGTPFNAVRATTRRTQANSNAAIPFFLSLFGIDSVDIAGQAIAISHTAAGPCVIALDTSADAIIINSNSSITATSCSLQSNGGIDSNSGSSVAADSICVAGGATGSGYSPSPTTGCPIISDPYAYLTPPAVPPPCTAGTTDKVVTGTETLSPGRYCGKLEVNSGGVANLDPGIYYMDDAEFIANSGSTINGTDVMIFLTGSAGRLKVNSGSHVDLSAATAGDYAGLLIYQDQSVTPLIEQLINSDSSSILNGVVYLPQSHAKVNSFGSTMTSSTGMQLVALKVEVVSDSSITTTNTVAGSGTGGVFTASLVK